MNVTPLGKTLGDFKELELLSEAQLTRRYRAKQSSVKRHVLLDVLKEEVVAADEQRESFLADIRAKAAVEHPLVASVYEANFENDLIYFAHEELTGQTLEELYEAGKPVLEPGEIASILQQISAASMEFKSRGLATVPLSLDHVYLPTHIQPRMTNLVVSGERLPEAGLQDRRMLGAVLHDLMIPKLPGATRIAALTEYMSDQERNPALTWKQVHKLATEVVEQLTEAKVAADKGKLIEQKRAEAKLQREKDAQIEDANSPWMLIFVLLLLGAFGSYVVYDQFYRDSEVIAETEFVSIPEGKYSEGETRAFLDAFEMQKTAVTVTEYSAFLDALKMLPASVKSVYDHKEQPVNKRSHLPDSWSTRVTQPQEAVTGIDWWDAYAYAKWQKAELPSALHWSAARDEIEAIDGEWLADGKLVKAGRIKETVDRSERDDSRAFRIVRIR